MKALILLATLKRSERSNTETLCEFFTGHLERAGVSVETVKLVEHAVLPGTYTDMGAGDGWPQIYEKVVASEILIFATPIWWGTHSSEMQKVIERLDEVHDMIMEGKPSPLEKKVAGILITGDGDGAEHIIGTIANFLIGVGVLVPPYATLSALSPKHAKTSTSTKEEILEMYAKDYAESAAAAAESLKRHASLLA